MPTFKLAHITISIDGEERLPQMQVPVFIEDVDTKEVQAVLARAAFVAGSVVAKALQDNNPQNYLIGPDGEKTLISELMEQVREHPTLAEYVSELKKVAVKENK